MKKILILLFFFNSAIAYSQEAKKDKQENPGRVDYYAFKNSSVIHFRPTGEAETILTDVSFMNGIIITAKGELVDAKGERRKLLDGECVNGEGSKAPCAELEQKLKKSLSVKQKD